ncbi:hypothetical protein BZA77DRAFT_388636 [Pyronema omphalodes]|nr:hypothetical protein BZA77DRAFT_388636 [Pyronema omphalodes]
MLKCRSCALRQINSILSIHQASARSFSSTSSNALRNNTIAPPRRVKSKNAATNPLLRNQPKDPKVIAYEKQSRAELQEKAGASTDAKKVAEEVEKFLNKGDVAKAHRLLERAPRKLNTVYSWNSLMKHSLHNRNVTRALKFYNEMKKRGINPDSHTYVILISGLASQPEYRETHLQEALKIYAHAREKNDNVRLNTMHTNALLSVAMKAKDTDQAFKIISGLPNGGINAPDSTTYTIFLRALKEQGKDALEDGKRVWAGVLGRFHRGDLVIDQLLANAYIEMLAHGPDKENWIEAFVAASQIFNLELPEKLKERPMKEQKAEEGKEFEEGQGAPEVKEIKKKERDDPFFGRWINFDDFTLGILLKAAENLKDIRIAQHIWEKTTEAGLQPTSIAMQRYLRCCSICHAGAAAAEFVEKYGNQLNEWNFVMAMKACVTSGHARECVKNASRILKVAEDNNCTGLMLLRHNLLVAMTTKDHKLIKNSMVEITKHITPKAMEAWFKKMDGQRILPREKHIIAREFVFTLKKAVFWHDMKYARFEESQWMDRFRDVKKIVQSHTEPGRRKEEEEDEEDEFEDDEDTQKIIEQAAVKQEKPKVEKKMTMFQQKYNLSEEPREGLRRVLADLRKFSDKERKDFLKSL